MGESIIGGLRLALDWWWEGWQDGYTKGMTLGLMLGTLVGGLAYTRGGWSDVLLSPIAFVLWMPILGVALERWMATWDVPTTDDREGENDG